jgi:hypothetical protein
MYELKSYQLGGLTLLEAFGSPFSSADLWELTGEKSRVATFTFMARSPARATYGREIVGVILYPRQEREGAPATLSVDRVRIEVTMRGVSPEAARKLKYDGIALADIELVQFVPFDCEVEFHETGEKKIPNVIEIPYEHDPRVNVDRLTQSSLILKNNAGTELAGFEEEQLVGITLGLNDGRIDSRILNHFGFDETSVKDSMEVWFHFLSTKQRQGKSLSERELETLADVTEGRRLAAFAVIAKELLRSRLTTIDPDMKPVLERVMGSGTTFQPSTLLTCGKWQVHWTLESYAHIALRHVKGLQVGQFTDRTIFPYRAEDLKALIEKVLRCAEDEIAHHFESNPGKPFYLAGSRCVYFNGDYYALRIDPSGRLVNFHRCAPRDAAE